ncbi:trichome differentiation protein GL1, putative [Entamoeba invadens IP1]|uniref:Trichome differentiation protein GL1, putative n=1 Tax=Entamoeba invadens IP1 TaxID=370355 RepID=A0A0A1U9N9_ENTIV|nr:trichome differentiation protein GL1, putative [Entamoeba invadens IP1]ELP91639.1 trichome differentiation protein GL1, putative [Entamoeba invadens IP1]|eukprot:XP_004258410.1 trichome differentiation protein GL1, putative [Entamoeba invadens IP1]
MSMEVEESDNTHTVYGQWAPEEDAALLKAVQEIGLKNWKKVELFVPKRNRKQCRERYFNSLMFKSQKRPWLSYEDTIIIQTHNEVGNKWTFISKKLVGRSANDVKNRYFGSLKKNLSKGSYKENSTSDNEKQSSFTVFRPVDSSLYTVL